MSSLGLLRTAGASRFTISFVSACLLFYLLGTLQSRIAIVYHCIEILGQCLLSAILSGAVVSYLTYYSNLKLKSLKVDPTGKAVLITGCDSGFGFETALRLYCGGFHVFAGCLDSEINGGATLAKVDGSQRLVPLTLDVTNQEHVNKALETVTSGLATHNLELWAIINNAGVVTFCELELCSLDTVSKILEVNTLGAIRVTQKFLPLLRQSQGRLIMISSLAGKLAYPGLIAYCMSKHALVALADGLRQELKKWNISVSTILCTGYRTRMLDPAKLLREMEAHWRSAPEDVRAVYGEGYFRSFSTKCIQRLANLSGEVGEAVDVIVTATESIYPKDNYYSCMKGQLRALARFLPTSGQDPYMMIFESFQPLLSLFRKETKPNPDLMLEHLLEPAKRMAAQRSISIENPLENHDQEPIESSNRAETEADDQEKKGSEGEQEIDVNGDVQGQSVPGIPEVTGIEEEISDVFAGRTED
ncbi:hypothetical protein RvY_16184 [Ramazzottius varieornatus]|uniref:Uncharacterized protein n=1 Tax=Ramazzottius varieornatus TaxID=947166 RepID=A0A1D1VYX6_RAMVA|nr:hypothetical protein RvY_16184 [Ramazzottius varieornatus]